MITNETDIKIIKQENTELKRTVNKLRKRLSDKTKKELNDICIRIHSDMLDYKSLPPCQILIDAIRSYLKNDVLVNLSDSFEERNMRVEYVSSLMNGFYCMFDMNSMYNTPITMHEKSDLLNKQLVLISNLYNKPLPTPNLMIWCKNLDSLLRKEYYDYFKNVYDNIVQNFILLGFSINSSFVLSKNYINTSHPFKLLEELCHLLEIKKFINGDKRTLTNFLSMFSCIPTDCDGLIEWLDVNPKNKTVGLQSLYILFDVLFKYDKTYNLSDEKMAICSYFWYNRNGDLIRLKSEQLRSRSGKESSANISLRKELENIMAKFYPQ